jgi:hypothetical protein
MATILCIANPSDEPTKVGVYWMQKFADYAAAKGHQVIFQKTPTLQALWKALTEYNPSLIVANGHGGYKSLRVGDNILIGTAGYDKAIKKLIKKGDEPYFQGRIVLLLTCNAGTELVAALVKNGALAAMGFNKPFIFLSDEDIEPEEDPSSKPFFECLMQPAIQLADGATFQQAVNVTREAFKHYITETKDKHEKEALKYLNFDLENLVALGDPNAKLT